jgi:hypothetical protein
MSFASSINTVLNGNSSLNSQLWNADGSTRIYAYNYPDNLDVNLSAIVFTYKKENGTHTLGAKNVLEDYSLYIVILSPDPGENETIADLVHSFLDEYQDANILDVTFDNDNNGEDQEKGRYFKVLEYKVIFDK